MTWTQLCDERTQREACLGLHQMSPSDPPSGKLRPIPTWTMRNTFGTIQTCSGCEEVIEKELVRADLWSIPMTKVIQTQTLFDLHANANGTPRKPLNVQLQTSIYRATLTKQMPMVAVAPSLPRSNAGASSNPVVISPHPMLKSGFLPVAPARCRTIMKMTTMQFSRKTIQR